MTAWPRARSRFSSRYRPSASRPPFRAARIPAGNSWKVDPAGWRCDNLRDVVQVDRIGMAVLLGCALTAPAAAQPRMPPPRMLEAPGFTIHPQGALPTLAGESVDVVVGWRPVVDAARYRVSLSSPGAPPVEVETTGLRFEKRGLPAGTYQLTVTAIDRFGAVGTPS